MAEAFTRRCWRCSRPDPAVIKILDALKIAASVRAKLDASGERYDSTLFRAVSRLEKAAEDEQARAEIERGKTNKAATHKATEQVRAKAFAEDTAKVSELKEALKNRGQSGPEVAKPQKKNETAKPSRTEAKVIFAEQIKKLRGISQRCYQEILRLRQESGIAIKVPFSKAKKGYEALMALSLEIDDASLPERYGAKTKEEFDDQVKTFERRLQEIIQR